VSIIMLVPTHSPAGSHSSATELNGCKENMPKIRQQKNDTFFNVQPSKAKFECFWLISFRQKNQLVLPKKCYDTIILIWPQTKSLTDSPFAVDDLAHRANLPPPKVIFQGRNFQ
jgi:hypothetical protein